MSIFDDKPPLNIPFPTLGGEVFWDNLEYQDGYTLQRNKIDKHCRILDVDDIRVAWGTERQMRAKFEKLTSSSKSRCAKYGDVIGVHRGGGLYDHYGVYESDDCVYEYAAKSSDFGSEIEIHQTTLKKFIGDSDSYFVLTFPERCGPPGKLSIPDLSLTGVSINLGTILRLLSVICSSGEYHLYSPDETIERAKSRLGEKEYNLVTNNCEHYAIWCKTGMKKSHQVDAFLKMLKQLGGVIPVIRLPII